MFADLGHFSSLSIKVTAAALVYNKQTHYDLNVLES